MVNEIAAVAAPKVAVNAIVVCEFTTRGPVRYRIARISKSEGITLVEQWTNREEDGFTVCSVKRFWTALRSINGVPFTMPKA
jgi:hypothetical protein